jgi:nitrite reductase (NADH) large subunit
MKNLRIVVVGHGMVGHPLLASLAQATQGSVHPPHVTVLCEEQEAMKACGAKARTGVVVGGGLLGLEGAKALRDMGLQTQVVELAPRLMAVQVDEDGGRVLRHMIEALDVQVHTQKDTQQIVDGETARHRMLFADGSALETDLIVFSAGIRPRDEVARASGLDIGTRGGVAIDSECRSSDPDIIAIGECAAWNGQTFGLVAPVCEMARVAARQLTGQVEAVFVGADMSTKPRLMGVDVGVGVDVASIGDAHGNTPGCRSCWWSPRRSTRTTSTCAPAPVWRCPSTRCPRTASTSNRAASSSL